MNNKTTLNNILHTIRTLDKNPIEQYELELRVNRRTSSIPKASHLNMYEYRGLHRDIELMGIEYTTSTSVNECYENGFRTINGKIQKKDKIQNYNQVLDNKTKVNLILSRELNVSGAKMEGDPLFKRTKKTSSFQISSMYRLDMSEVIDSRYSHTLYEVEIEFTQLTNVTKLEIEKAIDFIRVFITSRMETVTLDDVSRLLYPHNTKLPYFFKFPFNKPINYKDTWSTFVIQHTLPFRKLNGERALIYIKDHLLHIITEYQGVQIINSSYWSLNNSIFDAERVGKHYYIFDTLVFDGKNVMHMNYADRNYFTDLAFTNHISAVRTLIRERPMPMDHHTLQLIVNDTEVNDGIVFIPKNEPYSNGYTYKYKPPALMTIDFALSKDKKWLLVNTGDKCIVFKGTDIFPTRGVAPKNAVEGVGEYSYNRDTKTFVFVRPRLDKNVPNFLTIAIDVWKDIHCPPRLPGQPPLMNESS